MPRKTKKQELIKWLGEYNAYIFVVKFADYNMTVLSLAEDEKEAKIRVLVNCEGCISVEPANPIDRIFI